MEVRIMRPQVSALFMVALAEIRERGGVPTDEEIVHLHRLAERQVLSQMDDPPAFFTPPVLIGKLWLYPLTIQAHIWLEKYAYRWWPDDNLFATAYALAHSDCKRGDLFPTLTNRKLATARVNLWAWYHLPFSKKVVSWACKQLINRENGVPVVVEGGSIADENWNSDIMEWGEIIGALCSAYKDMNPRKLLYQMGMNEVMGLMASMPIGEGMVRASDDPVKKRAYAEYRMVIAHIIQRGKPVVEEIPHE